jgi:HPt (histidine-containing phosphotransfer) domain-containing protein
MVEAEITQERVETLEAQLAEREQLVAALTERLEQAAEQLDRLHRTGADRGVRSGILGIPPELIAQQQKLVEDLQQAVQQWEDMQPGAFFGRLESQLTQIHDLVLNYGGSGSENGSAQSPTDAAFSRGDSRYESSSTRRNPSDSPKSVLEFMKASFQAESSLPADESSAEGAESAQGNAAPPVLNIDLPPLRDPPEPVDAHKATREELADACEVRDAYVVYLLQRLRQIESMGHVPNSWAGLENLPDQLRDRLEALEKRLEETLRLAEVELSLQRAKLAREEVRIRVIDEQLQKDLKRARDDASSSSESDGGKGEASGSSRWKRMLGGRKGDNA